MKLVSAIMPTRGRPEWAQQAVRCFAAQDYPEKELIVMDDLYDRSFPVGLPRLDVKALYFLNASRSIAEKRNLCAELAAGEIIVHVDSDDWSDPTRISDQVRRLDESGKAVVGYHSILFTDVTRAWKYAGDPSYALGTSLCYRREFWRAHQFWNKANRPTYGEDNNFVEAANNEGQLLSVDAGQLMVARIHEGNTSYKYTDGFQYQKMPLDALPKGFFQ